MCRRIVVLSACVLVAGLTAQAATFTIVDLPATGTDAAIGISGSKTYTHAFDFGGAAPVTINGIVFERGPTANVRAVFTGTSRQGYGYTIGDTRASVQINTHAGNDPTTQASGDSAELLRSMIYHAASTTVGAGMVLTLSNLVPGTTYSTRFYYRNWSLTGPDASRRLDFKADGESHGVFSDVINAWLDAGGAHYVDYTFIADDTDVTFQFITTVYNYGVHIYGFTNEVLRVAGCSTYPGPVDKGTDVLRDVVLTWQPGLFAATHDVYFGTTLADVEAASRTNPLGVLIGQAQDANTFDPGRLEFGQTYYWRVDEVNAAPDNTVFAGKPWSFTVEPRSYTVTAIKVTASSAHDGDSGPEKTIDGSGLNAAGGEHSTDPKHMWLSSAAGPQPAWIQYEFDRPQALHQMLVWNSNQAHESIIGFGARSVLVEYCVDPNDWTALGELEFARASGQPTYAGDTPIDFGGAVARYVKLTIKSNWGGMVPQYSLSEVRFRFLPMRARQPNPAADTTGVAATATLSWRYGRQAATHDVYLGIDPNNLTRIATVTQPTCEVEVDLGRTYCWKVVEVNAAEDPAAWESDVWRFTAQPYLVVDDFESYTNASPDRVFQTWIDGAGFSPDEFFPNGNSGNATGALIGYDPLSGNIMQTTRVHGGRLSVPLYYGYESNATSETTRTFDEPQDWTRHGIQSLALYFTGMTDNKDAQLYVRINNGAKLFFQGAADDLRQPIWVTFAADLAAAGVSLKSVSKLTIGVEGAGATGTLLIDNVRLYPKPAETTAPVAPSADGLVAHYRLDGDGQDVTGKHNGTLVNSPTFVDGKDGQALNVTLDQCVNVPYATDLSLNTFSVAVWANVSDIAGNRGIIGTRFNGDNTFDLKISATLIHGDIGNGTAWLNTAVDVPVALSIGEWYHICYVFDDPADTVEMYVNGLLAGKMTITGTPLLMKSGQDLRIGTDYPTEPFRGSIDDVRIYNRPLSGAEVAGLADRTAPVYKPL